MISLCHLLPRTQVGSSQLSSKGRGGREAWEQPPIHPSNTHTLTQMHTHKGKPQPTTSLCVKGWSSGTELKPPVRDWAQLGAIRKGFLEDWTCRSENGKGAPEFDP